MTAGDRSFAIAGSRTGFLLVHGLGGTPLELRMTAKGIASGGFTVHCCQLAGHCGTEEELLATNWPQWYASVEAARAALGTTSVALCRGAAREHHRGQRPRARGL